MINSPSNLKSGSIRSDVPSTVSSGWFRYPIRVQPHHTDYGGVVWHGTYITWMESARVECLRAVGAPFNELVALGYDLPVVDMAVRYRQPLTLGMDAVVKTRLAPGKGIRLRWLYEIETASESLARQSIEEGTLEKSPQLCVTGEVTLVTVSMRDRKIVRRLPEEIQAIATKITTLLAED